MNPIAFKTDKCEPEVIVIVDPISTGIQVTEYLQNLGIRCIAVLSDAGSEVMQHYASALSRLTFEVTLNYDGEPEATTVGQADPALMRMVRMLHSLPFTVVSVLPGCETGVTLAERLASTMGLRFSHGMEKIKARRDKYYMAEAVSAAGLRSVRQVRPETWEDIEEFVEVLNPSPFRVIMKPSNSAGSDGVVCCKSMEEVRARWDHIKASQGLNALGLPVDILVQEFLDGSEYVVDGVSREGEHKIMCVWKYEKMCINGGDFIYASQTIVPPPIPGKDDSGLWCALVDYNNKMLDALDIKNGASHAEIMVKGGCPDASSEVSTPDFDICLVEVGARCHGSQGAFIPVADRCIGYNQAQITASAYTADGAEFHALPPEPIAPLRFYGAIAWLVSHVEGTFEGLRAGGGGDIEALPSFVGSQLYVKPGGRIARTIGVLTTPGAVTLAHATQEQVEADIRSIRNMEEDGLFMVLEGGEQEEEDSGWTSTSTSTSSGDDGGDGRRGGVLLAVDNVVG